MSGGIGKGLGSIGGAFGNVVGNAIKPMNAIGSAVGSLGGAGNVLGPAIQLAGGANPLGVFGASLGSQLLNDLRKSGGSADRPNFIDAAGNMIYADPTFNYGKNTYSAAGKPIDASRYFISGEKGMYNLLPKLGDIYLDQQVAQRFAPKKFFQNPANAKYGLTNFERASQAYNDIFNAMKEDAKAQTEFSSRYGPKTASFNPLNFVDKTTQSLPSYIRGDLFSVLKNQFSNPYTNTRGRNPFIDPVPVTYHDFGFGPDAMTLENPYEALANYAQAQNNPFFVGYKPAPTPAPAPTAPQPSPTGMRAGGLVALAKKR